MSIPTEAELEKFATTSPREITYNLQRLVYGSERVTVNFDDGRESMLTVLIDLDEGKGLLYFDWGGAESVNRRLLASPRNIFVAAPLGVRNQFVTGKVWQVDIQGRPAFATALPTRYVRLQRREYFRLTLPMTQRPMCRFRDAEGRDLAFPACDIGIGGVGIEAADLPISVAAGTVLHGGRIDLGSYGVIHGAAELRYTTPVQRGGKSLTRIGLAFGELGGGQEMALQKYITHVQKEMRAKGV